MFNIDKKKFGAFVAALRKEKGITQKELSEQLCMFPSVSVVGNNHSSPNGKRFVGNIYICGVFFINKSNFHSLHLTKSNFSVLLLSPSLRLWIFQ